jgi:hypothetical protein
LMAYSYKEECDDAKAIKSIVFDAVVTLCCMGD